MKDLPKVPSGGRHRLYHYRYRLRTAVIEMDTTSTDLFDVQEPISSQISILLIHVDVLKEVAEEMRQPKGRPGLVREEYFDVVADIAWQVQLLLLEVLAVVLVDACLV